MFIKKIETTVIAGAAILGLFLSGSAMAAFTADETAELLTEAKATVVKFKNETKGADSIFASAKGVLVCPKIRKMGVGVGTEGGKCVLTDGGTEPL